MAFPRKITSRDGVVRSIIRNNQDDPTHLCAIDAELLTQLYPDFSDCLQSQYDVYLVTEWADAKLNRVTLRGSPSLGQIELVEDTISPTLRHGDMVMAPHLPLFKLCQVDMDGMGAGRGARLTPLKARMECLAVDEWLRQELRGVHRQRTRGMPSRTTRVPSLSMER